jgi:hypothetical protein
MQENEFWVLIWKIIGGCFCVLVLTIGSCMGITNNAIINSPDPIASSCAAAMSRTACVIAQRK